MLPQEILVESRRTITRRLLRISWAPGLVLAGLWAVLALLYVFGTSPTMWTLSLLVGLGDPVLLRATVRGLGFTSTQLWTIFLLAPTLGPLLGAPLLPVAASAVARMRPREYLSEQAFQRAVAERITAILLAPPIAAELLVTALMLAGADLVHWAAPSGGTLAALAAAFLAGRLAWTVLIRIVSAPRVLGIEPVSEVRARAQLDRDPAERARAAKLVLAQDRRHLPPNPGTPQASAGLRPAGALRALAQYGRVLLVSILPIVAAVAWVIFSIIDLVAVFAGMSGPLRPDSPPVGAISRVLVLESVLVFVLFALAAGFAPGLAAAMAGGARSRVLDERTYEAWSDRARVNAWEARVVQGSAWIVTGFAAVALVAWEILTRATAVASAVTVTWTVIGFVILLPLVFAGAFPAMATGLRDVLYGPAGRYMRRETPFVLVAPEVGTRTEMARDPVVRAAMRERLRAEGGENALEVFDLDDADDRLWVDESAVGARHGKVSAADIEQGILPDFGNADDRPAALLPAPDAPPHAIPTEISDGDAPRA